MDLPELRRLSLGPELWDKLMRRSALPLELLDTATPLRTKASGSPDWPQLDEGCLVPGGRFFVVLNDCHIAAHLELWDLGIPGRKASPRPTVLALRNIKMRRAGSGHGWLLTVDFLPGSDVLRVAVAETGEGVR